MYEENKIYSGIGGISISNTGAAQRQPQLTEAFSGLDSVIEHHMKVAAEMEQRLAPVLRNEPEAAGSNSKEPATMVPAAQRVNEMAQRLQRVIDQYNSMLRRLEI